MVKKNESTGNFELNKSEMKQVESLLQALQILKLTEGVLTLDLAKDIIRKIYDVREGALYEILKPTEFAEIIIKDEYSQVTLDHKVFIHHYYSLSKSEKKLFIAITFRLGDEFCTFRGSNLSIQQVLLFIKNNEFNPQTYLDMNRISTKTIESLPSMTEKLINIAELVLEKQKEYRKNLDRLI